MSLSCKLCRKHGKKTIIRYWIVLNAMQQKSHLCIPFMGTVWPQSQFPHSCVCERFIYFLDRSAYSAAGKYVDRSWEYTVYISLIDTWMWNRGDWGRTIPFLEIHKWDFHCSVYVRPYLTWLSYVQIWRFISLTGLASSWTPYPTHGPSSPPRRSGQNSSRH